MTDEKVSLCAKSVEHASELNGNVPCTDECHLLGLPGNIEETVTVHAMLGPRNLRRDGWPTTNRHKDLLCVDDDLGTIIKGDLGLVPGEQAAPAVEVLNLVVVKVAFVDAVEALDVGVTLRLECGPVEGSGLLDGESVSFRVVDSFGECRGVESDLLGNTAGRFKD
jgi:hypothetical protein